MVKHSQANVEVNTELDGELDEDGFFRRWSRLKKQSTLSESKLSESTKAQQRSKTRVNHPTQVQSREIAKSEVAIPQSQSLATDEPIQPLNDADMPDIESLDGDSDYSGFLSSGVSEELRKLALRKLFNSEHFHIRDGLDDYDEEFTHFEKLGDIITADMRFQMEQEAQAKLEDLVVDEASDTNCETDPTGETEPTQGLDESSESELAHQKQLLEQHDILDTMNEEEFVVTDSPQEEK